MVKCPSCGEEIFVGEQVRRPPKLPASTLKVRQILTYVENALIRGIDQSAVYDKALKEADDFFAVYLRRLWLRGKRDIESELEEEPTLLNAVDLTRIEKIKSHWLEDFTKLLDKVLTAWQSR